jgi:lipopolysaccharide/colanic/teichoic acid biosynthesis glycosyltransferase
MIPKGRGVAYCRGRLKRSFDLGLALLGMLVLSPLLALAVLAVLVSSGRPVLFGHERRGLDGRPFRVLKFRTMRPDPGGGLPITGKGDPRITAVGRLLRSAKLDELPQLINVLRGEMSIVGPRPEVPKYVAGYSPDQRRVLQVRPGLTDPASVAFRDEEILLGSVDPGRREAFYLAEVLPRKLALNLEYIDRAGPAYDLLLILRTLLVILMPSKP